MKKKILYSLIGLSLILTSCGSGNKQVNNEENTSERKEASLPKPTPPKSEGPTRILFIGNSHTEYYASFPQMLNALCKANDKQVEVSTLIEMGVSIDKIIAANKSKADKLFAKKDTDGNYFDYVIMQESTPVAYQEENKYQQNTKMAHDLIAKNSPDVATYIYEVMFPQDPNNAEFKEDQKILNNNAINIAKSLPNASVLPFAEALVNAYRGKEGYVATKEGKDLLRFTDNSRHMLNDAVFLNSLILYKTLFGEMPKIPAELPLATGTGDYDEIKMMKVSEGISNPEALTKIANLF